MEGAPRCWDVPHDGIWGASSFGQRAEAAALGDFCERAEGPDAKKNLCNRRLAFWVKYGHWKLSSSRGSLEETTPSGPELDGCLDDLDGQRVIGIAIGPIPHSCILRFDLGAELEICPSKDATDDQWSLHNWNGKIIAYRNDGVIVFEPPS